MEKIYVSILQNMISSMDEHSDYLTDLDRQIGDSDHGINMKRGFHAIEDKLPEIEALTINEGLKKCGMLLLANVGGASGPLYGTLFIKMGSSISEQPTKDEWIHAFEMGIEGVSQRGKATIQEKTMLDVLIPVLESLKESNVDIDQAAYVAKQSVEKTKDMIATKGRASYLGERSRGVMDPGAYSSYLLIQAIQQTLKEGLS